MLYAPRTLLKGYVYEQLLVCVGLQIQVVVLSIPLHAFTGSLGEALMQM